MIKITWKSCSVYVDMFNDFDKVLHEHIILKLKQNSIECKLLALQKLYKNGKQSVLINGSKLSSEDTQSGVPLGSVVGPSFFLVYVNNPRNGIKSSGFADSPLVSAEELNHDQASKWHQRKIYVNPAMFFQCLMLTFL